MREKLFLTLIAFSLCLTLGAPQAWATPPAAPNPILNITVSPFPLLINEGARITITATNAGPDNADNVVITDGVPNNMAIAGASSSQGGVTNYNSTITVHVGTLAPGQTVTVYIDVVVVKANASDAPFYNCAGLTYLNGVARLSCVPSQPAVFRTSRTSIRTLPPNGARPISDPNRPPEFLPVAGSSLSDLSPILFVLGTAAWLMLCQRRRSKSTYGRR